MEHGAGALPRASPAVPPSRTLYGDGSMRKTILWISLFALILVPFVAFGERLDAWSVARLGELAGSRPAVALLVVSLLALDVFLPVPSSVVATLSGALLGVPLGTAAAWLGMTGGCLLAYGAGRYLGGPLVVRMVGPDEAERLRRVADRHGEWGLVLARAVPVLAEASTLLAGTGEIPLRRFLVVTGLANFGIALTYATVGALAMSIHSFLFAVAGASIVPAIVHLLTGGRS